MGMNPWTKEHQLFRSALRDYVKGELAPYADEWESQQTFPRKVFKELGNIHMKIYELISGQGITHATH